MYRSVNRSKFDYKSNSSEFYLVFVTLYFIFGFKLYWCKYLKRNRLNIETDCISGDQLAVSTIITFDKNVTQVHYTCFTPFTTISNNTF